MCMPELEESAMPKFVIERELVGAGKLPQQELQAISQKSCGVLHGMGPKIQWVQSYVTDDKIYCLYLAPDEGPCGCTPTRAAFRRTRSRECAPSSIRPRRAR